MQNEELKLIKAKLQPLSEEAKSARMPPPPRELVDALQDPIHREVKKSRPAKVARSYKNKPDN